MVRGADSLRKGGRLGWGSARFRGQCEFSLCPPGTRAGSASLAAGTTPEIAARFCIQQFYLCYSAGAGLMKPFLYLISSCAELFYRSTHPSGKLRQLLCTKQEQHDEQDYY
jgi:hypothetical protein